MILSPPDPNPYLMHLYHLASNTEQFQQMYPISEKIFHYLNQLLKIEELIKWEKDMDNRV